MLTIVDLVKLSVYSVFLEGVCKHRKDYRTEVFAGS